MVRFEHSQSLNSTLPMVWQVVSDIANWPTLYDELVRVQIGARANDEVRVTGTDSRARSFSLKVGTSATDESDERTVTLLFDASAPHPLGYRSLVWTVSEQGERTHLTLTADYVKPWPVIGSLLARLRGHGNASYNLQSTFDAVVRQSQEQALKYHETVQTVLSRKGSDIISARPSDAVSSICELINKHRIGAVLVLDSSNNLVGLVSERDIIYHLARTGTSVLDQNVEDIMTRDLIVCEPESDLLFVMACMTDNKIRHLPVMENNQLRGVISIGDVVQQRMHALEAESDTLRNYIAAREWRVHGRRVAALEAANPLADTAK